MGTLGTDIRSQAEGDASAVLDAVTIIRRSADDALIYNPSFETSGDPEFPGYMKPAKMAGFLRVKETSVSIFRVKGLWLTTERIPSSPPWPLFRGLVA